MSREAEVVAYLRDDTDLGILLPGGVYSYVALGVDGLTNSEWTPDVWEGDVFQACAIVRMRSPVPTGQLTDFKTQTTDTNQVGEVRVYALDEADIEAGQGRIYALTMGHAFTAAWRSEWVFSVPAEQAPELPAGIKVERRDYRIRALKQPA